MKDQELERERERSNIKEDIYSTPYNGRYVKKIAGGEGFQL